MLLDFRTLLRVEIKRATPVIVYWLKTMGCDPATGKGYQLYMLGFWGVWLYLAGAYAVDNAFRASAAIPIATLPLIFQAIPSVLFAVQLLYLATLLREPPLRLTAAEMAHIAASPVSRRLITLIHLGRALLLPLFPVAALSGLLSATLTHLTAPALATAAGIQGILVAFPLVVVSMAVAWAVALPALQRTVYPRRGWLWLAIPLLILAAMVLPSVALFPGIVWRATIGAMLTPTAVVLLCVAAFSAIALVGLAGDTHMGIVAERSQTYARVAKLGFLGQVYARDLIRRIERQSQLAKKRWLFPRLSTRALGDNAIRSRTLVAMVRPSWWNGWRPLAQGAFLTSALIGILSVGGATFQTGLLLLVTLLVVRLGALVEFFQQELDVPFMRALNPAHLVALFVATAWWPGVLVTIGGVGAVLAQAATIPLFAAVLVPLVVAALGLAQALERVDTGFLAARRLPYFYTVLVSGSVVVSLSLFFKSLLVAFILLLVVNGVLAAILYSSRA